MKIQPMLDLTLPTTVVGTHSIWLSKEQVKVPFQFGGRITKYRKGVHEGSTALLPTFAEELSMLRALAEQRMAPPIGDVVYFKSVLSNHLGDGRLHHDPMGAYGYEMADVNKLAPGEFSVDRMRALPISGSPGAWNDINKPGNVTNGYLIDVRRTWWDMLRWTGDVESVPSFSINVAKMRERVTALCQFPPGERDLPYQEYWLDGAWQEGSRSVRERAAALGFSPGFKDSVLDIGCQSGGFCQFAALKTTGLIAGVDNTEEYIECGRQLARAAQHNIHFQNADASLPAPIVEWARRYFDGSLDHLLLLSIDKHIGEPALWELADGIGARVTYLETSAQKADTFALRAGVEARGGRYLGDSNDRGLRRLYRIDRP